MGEKIIRGYYGKYKHYLLLVWVAAASLALFFAAYRYRNEFDIFVSAATYLTWHNIFEFTAIVISFAVFFVSYYSYEQTRNLRSILLGAVFLTVGILDTFHTLSFKGMPDFFVPNVTANRATTFWIIARLSGGAGYVAASCISANRTANARKKYFVLLPLIFSFIVFILVTYFPSLLPPMFLEGSGLTPVKIYLEYVVILFFFITVVNFVREYGKTRDLQVMVFAAAMLIRVFSEIAFVSYSQVYDVYNYLGHVFKFIAYFLIFQVIFINNVRKPYIELSKAQRELKDYAENLDRIVDHRTRQLKQMNVKLIEDLEYARDVQKAMLPQKLPREQDVVFSAGYYPAEHLSGDYYNVFKLDEENLGICIADVSGHGVSAAMLTVFLNQALRTCADDGQGGIRNLRPSEVLKDIYVAFNRTNFREDVYIVLIYAVYNRASKTLTYASAGMNAQPFVTKKSGRLAEVEIKGFPICKFLEFHPVEYSDSELVLESGDKLIFYSDGLLEAENEYRVRFSEERLRKLLSDYAASEDILLAEAISKSVDEFTGGHSLRDDITYVIMEVR